MTPYDDQAVRVVAAQGRGESPFGWSELQRPMPEVRGACPACGCGGLVLADGGFVTCMRADCPDPGAASALLAGAAAQVRMP
ncbi:hypothetical protein [Streptomyces chilikensis]|uniref:Uncharacterized protein n=1 Tax=Streptomyces chilikensis TaxID=1194079 RepID=A0ABV3EJ94_9ACTN